jgi:hypothetical protein
MPVPVGDKVDALMHGPLAGEGIDAPAIGRGVPLRLDRQAGGQQALPDAVFQQLRFDHRNRVGLGFHLLRQGVDRALQFASRHRLGKHQRPAATVGLGSKALSSWGLTPAMPARRSPMVSRRSNCACISPSLTAMALRFSRARNPWIAGFLGIHHAQQVLQEGQADFRGMADGDIGKQRRQQQDRAKHGPGEQHCMPPGQGNASCGCQTVRDENNMHPFPPIRFVSVPAWRSANTETSFSMTSRSLQEHLPPVTAWRGLQPRPTSAPIPASVGSCIAGGAEAHARVANFRLGKLLIHAENGAVAAKIRQFGPRLASDLSNKEVKVTQIEVRVQARNRSSAIAHTKDLLFLDLNRSKDLLH